MAAPRTSMNRRAVRSRAEPHPTSEGPSDLPTPWCALCGMWQSVQGHLQSNHVGAHELYLYGFIAARVSGNRPICSRHRSIVERMCAIVSRRMP